MSRKTFGKKNPNLPFYPAVRAGDFIFISGQVPKDENGNMFSGTIEEETRCCIESVRRALKEAGADLEDVVKATVFLEDARDFGRYNGVFAKMFPHPALSRTTLEARAGVNTKNEIEANA